MILNADINQIGKSLDDELNRIDLLLEMSLIQQNPDESDETHNEGLKEAYKNITEQLKEARSEDYPLEKLCAIFNLTELERDLLLFTLAPALDGKYRNIYALIETGFTPSGHVTIQLLSQILGLSLNQIITLRTSLSSRGTLGSQDIIRYGSADALVSRNGRALVIDERIVDFILGESRLDEALVELLVIEDAPEQNLERLLEEENRDRIKSIVSFLQEMDGEGGPCLIHFYGPVGSGKSAAAGFISRSLGRSTLKLNLRLLLQSGENLRMVFKKTLRELQLRKATLLVTEGDSFLGDEGAFGPELELFMEELGTSNAVVFLNSEQEMNLPVVSGSRLRLVELYFPPQGFEQRKDVWEEHLNGRRASVQDLDLDELAASFQFTGGKIRNVVKRLVDRSEFLRKDDSMNAADVYDSCRAENNLKLTQLASRVERDCSWEDLVLPENPRDQLLEIRSHLKNRESVFSDWGFRKKGIFTRGVSVLFSGKSGTGKTLAAGIIARDLNLELYKIDLSSVVSKYIGETEKNLSRIFQEALEANAILFFDEADALFGKRSEVKDAHDRHANIEVGYLLQKMEEHTGVTILATNLRENMDDAFLRRLQFVVEFPFPEAQERSNIWKSILPGEAPLDENVDFEFLGAKIKLAGGNIRNMALNAAFYAREEGAKIGMKHFMSAVRREYEKQGRLFIKGDMAPYHELIQKGD